MTRRIYHSGLGLLIAAALVCGSPVHAAPSHNTAIQVQFDDTSGELKRVLGDLGPAEDSQTVRATVEKYRALFLDPAALSGLRFTRLTFEGNEQFYRFQQTYQGLEVFGSDLVVGVSHGRLRSLTNGLKANLELDIAPRIGLAEAERIARCAVRSKEITARTRLVVYARTESPVLAYAVALDHSTVLVNAQTAQIIEFTEPVRFSVPIE